MSSQDGLHTAINRPFRSFSAAFTFLTVFPWFKTIDHEQRFFRAAIFYFTIVGLLTGTVVGFGGLVLASVAPPLVVAVAVTVSMSFISGFLHLDGLADTADGFMSSRGREQCLVIMKDSRIGVMGAAAIAAVLMAKTSALASLPAAELVSTVMIAAAAGRTATVVMMSALPYARSEGGLGNLFSDTDTGKYAAIISVCLLGVVMILLAPQRMVLLVGISAITVVLFCSWCVRKIGGYTGDTLGAVCELTEVAVLSGAVLNI